MNACRRNLAKGEQKTDMADPRLTFSQAAEIDPLPRPAKLGELPSAARNAIWSLVFQELDESESYNDSGDPAVGPPWDAILYDFHVSILNEPGDEFYDDLSTQLPRIKKLFLKGDYNRVFDLLQFTMRHELVPDGFGEFVATTLQNCLCAYSLATFDGIWTIVPSAIPEQRISLENALRVLTDGPFGGARKHLSKSADCTNAGDYSGSVRESIHAVESVARRLDSNAAKTLSSTLASLSNRGLVLHGAFKSGIEALYGYASDEDGIRHSLSDATTNVDVADAVFMFGACASFAAYLVEKARGLGLLVEE